MPDRDAISRIAKILARAGSDNLNEAHSALEGAFKRMVRDGVTLHDLLSLPTDELYQDTLVKLVDLILADQPDLSPPSKREAYSQYLLLIAARFSGAWDGQPERSTGDNSSNGKAGQGRSREEEAREYERRRRTSEQARREEQSTTRSPPNGDSRSETGSSSESKNVKTQKSKNGYEFSLGQSTFSFSPAGFLEALQALFGRGSVIWHSLHDPIRALRLFAACFLFGAGFASIILIMASIVHTLTQTGPLWNIRLSNAFAFLVAVGFLWKARALHHQGWFR